MLRKFEAVANDGSGVIDYWIDGQHDRYHYDLAYGKDAIKELIHDLTESGVIDHITSLKTYRPIEQAKTHAPAGYDAARYLPSLYTGTVEI